MGKVKWLKLWWRLYVMWLPVWDLKNFRPLKLHRKECTSATIWLHTKYESKCNPKCQKSLLPTALFYHYRSVHLYKIYDRTPYSKVTKNDISFAMQRRCMTQCFVKLGKVSKYSWEMLQKY
jgi:hypothetical protein